MKKILMPLLASVLCFLCATTYIDSETHKEAEDPTEPNDWFYLQRSGAGKKFDYQAYDLAMSQVAQSISLRGNAPKGASEPWQIEGPTNIGGRITCLAIDERNHQIRYAGCPAGGLFKTTDGGKNWSQLFDGQSNLAIACISIDPHNSNKIWIGTGDPDISGYPMAGEGIYLSNDGGKTWKYKGLKAGKIIPKITIDPTDSNTIYAAAMGLPMERNNDRGLYKSTDGGNTWKQILYIKNEAGINDFILDLADKNHLIASAWNRIRSNKETLVGGKESRLYQSFDAGQTWSTIIFNSAADSDEFSRIGLYQHPKFPNIILANMIENNSFEVKYLMKSSNGGRTFTTISANLPQNICSGFGWYFARTWMDPIDTNEIYIPAVDLYRTTDGGNSWSTCTPAWFTYEVHADKHAMQMLGSDTVILGTDGGIYQSFDNCVTWSVAAELPITQFYRVAVDPHRKGIYSGGAQDNGTSDGNSKKLNGWTREYGGDGFQPLFHPTQSGIRYFETQNGNVAGISSNWSPQDRVNWDMPLLMSRFNPDVIYGAAHYVARNDQGFNGSFSAISNDLTDGNIYGSRFHNISALCESAFSPEMLFAGTSDGNLWRTFDGGNNWLRCDTTLPDYYITSIKTSLINKGTVYMTNSGYKMNNYIPHIHKSLDSGITWMDISGDLPQIAINDICPDPNSDSVIYLATDGGVYMTIDSAKSWFRLGNNMPVFPVYDLEVDTANHKLIAGTFARGIMSYPLDSILKKTKIISNNGIAWSETQSISVYPNPVSNLLYIKNSISQQYELYTLAGMKIRNGNLIFGLSTLDLSQLEKGIYYLVLRDQEKIIHTERIIHQ